MSGRVIAIADVHGCFAELEKLLSELSPGRDDTVVMLGDVVNRGPDSARAIAACRAVGARALMGNHERRLLRARSGKRWRKLNEVDASTYKSLSEEDWAWIESMEKTFEVPGTETVLVHGGFAPGKPWREQKLETVTEIQVIDPDGRPKKRSDAPAGCPHWSDLWEGPPFVVYGHTPWHSVRRTEWTLGLDTGCVYGGWLSALVMPEMRIVQVRAAKEYYPLPLSWRHVFRLPKNG